MGITNEVHTHRIRVDEHARNGLFHGVCVTCGVQKQYPVDQHYDLITIQRTAPEDRFMPVSHLRFQR